MKRSLSRLLLMSLVVWAVHCNAETVVIDFEDYGLGPTQFSAATTFFGNVPGTTSEGVHFTGPAGFDGWAILNDNSGFFVQAKSGRNFLAVNSQLFLKGSANRMGGVEAITFDKPVSTVGFFAAASAFNHSIDPHVLAYDRIGRLIAQSPPTRKQGWTAFHGVFAFPRIE